MNQRSVPDILQSLEAAMGALSPQLRKAGAYILDHPQEVGLSSVRELAGAAGVKPNTLVRLAQALGLNGFDELREPFRTTLLSQETFSGRASWLQDVAASGRLGSVYADIAGTALENVEKMFAAIDVDELKTVADAVVAARRTYVVGVGANHALAQGFAYLVGMALDSVEALPRPGNVPLDSVVRAEEGDLMLSMTFAPYRAEVVEATDVARARGARIVAITDSHGSPIARGAGHVFLTPSAGPQFFPSTLAAAALLETLASFIVADAPKSVVRAIDRLHRQRHDLGVYWKDDA